MFTNRGIGGALLGATTAIAVSLASAPAILAGPLADAAAQAEEKAAAGDAVGAHDIIIGAVADFTMSLPFSVKKAIFVSQKPSAFGAYAERPDSKFPPGEPLVTYIELIGLTWKAIGDGKQQSNFSVDFEIADSKGEVLASQKGFGNFTFTGLVRNQEIFTNLTLDVTGAAPGDYLLRYTINDKVGGHFTTTEQPFTVVAQ